MLLKNKHNDFEHLRILAFGTSRTFGVGVNHQHKAFPSLISRNNTKNVAMKASGPQYSALCTQTMVGDDGLYDVILFEYNLLADDYLMILARRLRARFPQATMIFMRIWLPFQFRHVPSNKAVLQLLHERFGPAPSKPATELLASLVEGTQSEDWIFLESWEKKKLLERVATEVGGYVYHMPRPDNAIEALTTYARFYTPDVNHYTQAGHRFLQQQLVKVMHKLKAQRTSELGAWHDTDVCELWYETGTLAIQHEAPIVKFLNTRYALELATSESYLVTKNPFPDRSVSVWIDFMSGSPTGQYPKSRIRLEDQSPVKINPRLKGKGELHVMKHAYVGMLEQSAAAKLTVKALDGDAFNPFRIVGVAYTTIHVENGQAIV